MSRNRKHHNKEHRHDPQGPAAAKAEQDAITRPAAAQPNKEHKHNSKEPVVAKAEQSAVAPIAAAQPDVGAKPTPWIPAATLIATVVIAFIYYFQLLAMRHSNEINREALQAVQRAFVTCRNINNARKSHGFAKHPLHYWDISVTLENSGTTPALTAVSYYHTEELSVEPTDETFRGPKGDRSSPVNIGPKSFQNLGSRPTEELVLLGTDLNDDLSNADSINPAKNFFLWGWVVYRDVFSSTSPI